MEELVEMPDHATIDVEYFVGRQSGKVWLVSGKIQNKVYKVGSEIALWCDVQDAGETEEAGEDKRKRKHPDSHPSKRQDREDEVDTISHDLRHGDTYETPQFRLWARQQVLVINAC